MQQLQAKKAVDEIQAQLVSTGGLVKTLEKHHLIQSQQIEHNLKRAMAVYERARVVRQQQQALLDLIDGLQRDRDELLQVVEQSATL